MADIQHKNITGLDAAHPPFYASESDPTTTLGAYRGWFKPSTEELFIRNAANTAWLGPYLQGGSSGGHTIQDEGSNLTARTNLNFTGAGVTVTDDAANDQTDVTIPGGNSSATTTTQGIIELATQAEVNAGTDAARAVTPSTLAGRTASETQSGVIEIATQTETNTGTDDARALTPAKLAARTATDTRAGVVELATQAETNTGTDTTRAVTPSTLANYSGLGIAVEEDGSQEGTGIKRLNFTTGMDVSVTGTEATISSSGGGSGVAVEEDGTEEGTGIDRFDFTTGLNVSVAGSQATISATGGGGGYTPSWVQTGSNKVYVAWGDGNPIIAGYSYASSIVSSGPTPTQVGTTTVRCVKFRLPVALSLTDVWLFTNNSGSNLYTVGIFPWSNGASKLWDNSGSAISPTGDWVQLTSGLPVSLSANTDYAMCIGAPAASTTVGVFSLAAPSNLSNLYGAEEAPIGGLSIGLPEFAQFSTTAGAMPSTFPALSAANTWTGTVPFFWLVGTAS